MSIRTRPATHADAADAANVMRRSIRELCVEDHRRDPKVLERWLANKTQASVAGWVASADAFCVAATDADEALIGFGMLTRTGEILLLYVDPDAVNRGAGHALLEAMERRAREWRLATLTLDSTISARRFYERHGYIGRGECGPRADGLSCHAMAKQLDAG
jgi:GNAT superfamily N-acetyltransferase